MYFDQLGMSAPMHNVSKKGRHEMHVSWSDGNLCQVIAQTLDLDVPHFKDPVPCEAPVVAPCVPAGSLASSTATAAANLSFELRRGDALVRNERLELESERRNFHLEKQELDLKRQILEEIRGASLDSLLLHSSSSLSADVAIGCGAALDGSREFVRDCWPAASTKERLVEKEVFRSGSPHQRTQESREVEAREPSVVARRSLGRGRTSRESGARSPKVVSPWKDEDEGGFGPPPPLPTKRRRSPAATSVRSRATVDVLAEPTASLRGNAASVSNATVVSSSGFAEGVGSFNIGAGASSSQTRVSTTRESSPKEASFQKQDPSHVSAGSGSIGGSARSSARSGPATRRSGGSKSSSFILAEDSSLRAAEAPPGLSRERSSSRLSHGGSAVGSMDDGHISPGSSPRRKSIKHEKLQLQRKQDELASKQNRLDEQSQWVERERQLLREERLKLEHDRELFEFSRRLMIGMAASKAESDTTQQDSADSVVTINVGGEATLEVQRSTLRVFEGSHLANLFSGSWEKRLPRDTKGRVFFDNRPDVFVPLVDFLRKCRMERDLAIAADDSPQNECRHSSRAHIHRLGWSVPPLPKFQRVEQTEAFECLLRYFGLEPFVVAPVADGATAHSPSASSMVSKNLSKRTQRSSASSLASSSKSTVSRQYSRRAT